MPVQVLLVEHNHSDVLLIKDAALGSSLDVRITVAKDAETAVVLLFDPGFVGMASPSVVRPLRAAIRIAIH